MSLIKKKKTSECSIIVSRPLAYVFSLSDLGCQTYTLPSDLLKNMDGFTADKMLRLSVSKFGRDK